MTEFVHWPRLRFVAVAVAVGMSLAGCGSSATPAPAASAPAVPSPSIAAARGSPSSAATATPSAAVSPSAAAATSPTPPATSTLAPASPAPAAPTSTADAMGPCSSTSSPSPAPAPSAPAGTRKPPTIALRTVATGLAFPIGIVSLQDGSGRLFVVQQGGAIRIIDHGVLLDQPFLDIGSIITAGGERGLLGLAFHPDYRCNGRFFVNYTDLAGDTVVAEYRVSGGDPNRADHDQVARLLHITQPFPNHNGGDLVFGPDGMLYVGMGDGGSGGDPQGNGQRLDTLLAKMLRIDVDHPSDGRAYGIPAGNCAGCPPGVLPEIYAYGVRNPWRFTFDRATDDLWIGDVGQGEYEEVDHVTIAAGSGADFGWNRMEGLHCYPAGSTCDESGLVLPVAEYDHSQGDCSITGGYVYRGSLIPGLVGDYVFSDYCSGAIRFIDAAATSPADVGVLLASGRNLVSFGQDDAGELYLADIGSGDILEIVPGT